MCAESMTSKFNGYIMDILRMKTEGKTKHERDFNEVLADILFTLPLESGEGSFFVSKDDEFAYLSGMSLIRDLSSDLKANAGSIESICDGLKSYKVKTANGGTRLFSEAFNVLFMKYDKYWNAVHNIFKKGPYSRIMCILCMYNAATAIIKFNSASASDLLTNYMFGLVADGKENVMKVHKQQSTLDRRLPEVKEYVIQSILDPDFCMKTFLTKSPISMFFGNNRATRREIVPCFESLALIASGNETCLRKDWSGRWRDPKQVIARIHSKRTKSNKMTQTALNKLFPGDAPIYLAMLFIRSY